MLNMKYPGNIDEILTIMEILLNKLAPIGNNTYTQILVFITNYIYIYIYIYISNIITTLRLIYIYHCGKKLQRVQPSVSLNMRSPNTVVKIFM